MRKPGYENSGTSNCNPLPFPQHNVAFELDLHTHTNASHDSSTEPSDLIRTARKEELDGLAITDHNTAEAVQEVRSVAGGDLLIIHGMEVSTDAGHVLGYFLEERNAPDTTDPEEVVEWIHEQEGLAVIAHPFTRKSSVPITLAETADGIEELNYRYSRYAVPNADITRTESIRGVAHEHDLTLTAGSDAHKAGDTGRCRTIVESRDPDEIKSALRRGTCRTKGQTMSLARHLYQRTRRFLKRLVKPRKKTKKKKKKKKRPKQWD